ncbi:S8 family serine peptidase [Pseudomonas sp. A-R-19]|uniref:S8 family serine peptidase n=1 Tax=Pseudomonas sp. A-R-19 TaxID=2832403 RepID=UPI001CC11164|nr:S8 family serine peptidase [Pseudomonas sp. A-R-19]
MKSMSKWQGAMVFCVASLPLLVSAATPDYSHVMILVKRDVSFSESQGRAGVSNDSLKALKLLAPHMRPMVPVSGKRSSAQLQALQRHRLDRYFIVDTRTLTKKQAEALLLKIKQNPVVEEADFEPRVNGMHNDNGSSIEVAREDIPDHTGRQNYLQGRAAVSPYKIGGVNAVEAWKVSGGKGEEMQVVSAEIDHWAYDHVDLPKPYLEINVDAVTGSHDTSSAGTIVSQENGFGTTGIVPYAKLGYLQWGSERLVQLVEQLGEGDVVQLGVQYDYTPFKQIDCTENCMMPLEYNKVVRDTVAYITEEKGAHVVLAAANGDINLDHEYFQGYFDRNIFDSGAIYAGAVEPKTGLRAWYSEYGSRVDMFSWGENVTTTSWRRSNPTTAYTHTYAGTSSANPILAGVIASLQGVARANGLGNIPPKVLRELLVETGYPQINGNRTEIGVQPDLDAAIKKMLADGADKPPTGRLALPEEVASGETFSAHVYAESPSNKPLTYRWTATRFLPPIGNGESMSFTAPTVTADTTGTLSVDVSDGTHTLNLAEHVTIKAPVGAGECGDIPVWDAGKVYAVYAEEVAYKEKKYKQNFHNLNKQPDLHSAAFGKEWQLGVDCP